MVPYRVYGPDAGAAPPPAYSYVAGQAYPARYPLNPYYAGAGPAIPYRERAYYHHPYPRYAVQSVRIGRTRTIRIARSARAIDRLASSD
jgi:hypothetical protein